MMEHELQTPLGEPVSIVRGTDDQLAALWADMRRQGRPTLEAQPNGALRSPLPSC